MKRVQFVRDIATNANLFVGLEGEITVDLTAMELRVHNGTIPGGFATARKDLANVSAASTVNPGKMTSAQVVFLENSMQKPFTWTTGRLTKFDASGYPVDSSVTATEAQLNYLSGVTAGTRTASKAIVVDGSGFIDALGITTANITNLQLGGVAVTANAAELNYTAVTTPGVAQASKAVVLDANKSISDLGDVAIGGVARSWASMHGVVDIGDNSAIVESSNSNMALTSNARQNSGWKYVGSSFATLVDFGYGSGDWIFYTAPSGAAGNAITWTERFKISNAGVVTINSNTVRHDGNTFHGRVNNAGTAIRLPSGWSSAKTATGTYVITHNLGTANYTIATSTNYGGDIVIAGGNTTQLQIFTSQSTTGAAVDAGFNFTVIMD